MIMKMEIKENKATEEVIAHSYIDMKNVSFKTNIDDVLRGMDLATRDARVLSAVSSFIRAQHVTRKVATRYIKSVTSSGRADMSAHYDADTAKYVESYVRSVSEGNYHEKEHRFVTTADKYMIFTIDYTHPELVKGNVRCDRLGVYSLVEIDREIPVRASLLRSLYYTTHPSYEWVAWLAAHPALQDKKLDVQEPPRSTQIWRALHSLELMSDSDLFLCYCSEDPNKRHNMYDRISSAEIINTKALERIDPDYYATLFSNVKDMHPVML